MNQSCAHACALHTASHHRVTCRNHVRACAHTSTSLQTHRTSPRTSLTLTHSLSSNTHSPRCCLDVSRPACYTRVVSTRGSWCLPEQWNPLQSWSPTQPEPNPNLEHWRRHRTDNGCVNNRVLAPRSIHKQDKTTCCFSWSAGVKQRR